RLRTASSSSGGIGPTRAARCGRSRSPSASISPRDPAVTARPIDAPRRTVVIEDVAPAVDGGRYPVKREVGAVLEVSADIFKDGHDVLVAYLKYRRADERWRETPMRHVDNDRWAGAFRLEATGRYHYTIEALA